MESADRRHQRRGPYRPRLTLTVKCSDCGKVYTLRTTKAVNETRAALDADAWQSGCCGAPPGHVELAR